MRTKIWLIAVLALLFGFGEAVGQELVKGKVQDGSQQPIVGVSVSVEGDNNRSVSTDAKGEFTLQAKTGETLLFSSVEYEPHRLRLTNQEPVLVTLKAKDERLDEVVVIGYGSQKRSNLIAPVSKFNAEGLEERPIVRVDQALVGQMSGVRVKQTTGVPGKGLSVQVRGSGSITAGSEPLYVVDGFPLATAAPNGSGNYASGNPLDNMNPNDIESVEVLKDASAAAIYGSRAANGVVLITTKRGKTGQPNYRLIPT